MSLVFIISAPSGSGKSTLVNEIKRLVDEALAIIRSLPPERLAEEVTIQGYDGTVLKAIFHVVEHFSGHTAQIIFITKMLTGEDLGFYSYLSGKAHSNAGKTA